MNFSDIMSMIRNINYLKYISIYLLLMNLWAYFAMYRDKRYAIKDKRRISEKTFLKYCILGGTLGILMGMYHFRHKTKHWYFKYGIPLLLILQLGIMGYIYMSY